MQYTGDAGWQMRQETTYSLNALLLGMGMRLFRDKTGPWRSEERRVGKEC